MSDHALTQLHELSNLYGVQTSYLDVRNESVEASPETLAAILKSLGATSGSRDDLSSAVRSRAFELRTRTIEPVYVAWDGKLQSVGVTLPSSDASKSLRAILTLEDRLAPPVELTVVDSDSEQTFEADRVRFFRKQINLPDTLPPGYHRLSVRIGRRRFGSLIISSPSQAYAQPAGERLWGAFIPLYSFHTRSSWAAGNFSDLRELMHWVSGCGGRVVGTLPIMASFLEEPFDPSPYATASRLFWNEFYIDPLAIPEIHHSPEAKEILSRNALLIDRFRQSKMLEYRDEMALKKQVLLAIMHSFLEGRSPRRQAFDAFVKSSKALRDYARFRAAGERQVKSWHAWPGEARNGTLTRKDFDTVSYRYHLFVQWIAGEQLGMIAAEGKERDVRLYMDYPVGVHASSYDVWRHRACFSDGMSVGAPPDAFFTGGQDWGFPPLHPERIRTDRYQYVIQSLRNIFRHAGVVRLDHVMGLHRIFWIPKGMGARNGTYVKYSAEELYAILTLESHRNRSVIVGEDLGIVPEAVREAMDKRNLNRMHILQFEVGPDPVRCTKPVPWKYVASLNTHDTPPFASFWKGIDIEERVKYGFLKPDGVDNEKRMRAATELAMINYFKPAHFEGSDEQRLREMLRACLLYLAKSDAWMVLVNLEDLWMESSSQNIPGTYLEHPNWRRRARHDFETIKQLPFVNELLSQIGSHRNNRE